MNCAWCSPSQNGTDGICDACMLLYFRVDPATIHAEITAEGTQTAATRDEQQTFPIWEHLHCRAMHSSASGPLLS